METDPEIVFLSLDNPVICQILTFITPTGGLSPDEAEKERERIDAALLEEGVTAELQIYHDDRQDGSTEEEPFKGYYVQIYTVNKTPVYMCSSNITGTSVINELLNHN